MIIVGFSRPTSAPPTPVVLTEIGKVDWTHQGYVGIPLRLDFKDSIGSTIADVSPAIPHFVEDRILTIIPDQTSETATYTVTAGAEQVTFNLKVGAAPPRLAVTGTPQSFRVEPGRPLPSCPHEMHIEGTGIPSYVYEKIAGPDWIENVAGQFKGVAPDVVAPAEALTVRVTDGRGDTVDITRTVEVVDTYSRTPTHTLPAATTVMDFIAAQGIGSGHVLRIPKMLGHVSWGSGTPINIAWDTDPLIIIGDDYLADGDETVILAGADLSACSGIILEKITFLHATDPGGGIDHTIKCGERVFLYDCRHRGFRVTIDPNVGDWQNGETFTYNGDGPQMRLYAVAHNNVMDEIEEGLFFYGHPSLYGGAAYNTTILRYTDDGPILNELKSVCISGLKMNGPTGNYTSGQHQDFVQFYGNHAPAPRNVLIENFELSSDGHPMQGILTDHDGWGIWAASPPEMFNNVVIRNGFCFNGVWLTLAISRCYGLLVENCAFLLHPNANFDTYFSAVRTWDGSLATIRNCIYERVDNAGIANFPHLFTLQNNVDLPRLTSPTPAQYLSIFPNWDNDAITDPLQRFQFDPSWVSAHPDVGPTMLQTGTPATPAQPSLAAAPLVTSSSYQGAGSPKSISIGKTEPGDDIFVLTCNSTGSTVTMTTPANFETLQEISVNNTQVKLHRWDGTGTRPDNTTLQFTASATGHFMAQSWIVRGGQTAAGVHGAVNGASGSGPFSGPADLATAANSLVQHIWVDGTTRAVLPPTAPTGGFGASSPGAYSAEAGLVSNTIRIPIHLHWGTYGAGPYVTPQLSVSSYALVGCITVETRTL